MTSRPHGRHVSIDPKYPQALGICDYTGFVHMRKDLVRQMEWRGNAIVWTGFYVGKDYVDMPNAQLKPPILPPDPVPVREPRPQQPTPITWSGNFNYTWGARLPDDEGFALPVWEWASWEGCEDGIPVLPEAERLALLEQGGVFGAVSVTPGSINNPYLTQAQILEQLQQFNWGT